jgi:hypothetical protein
MLPFSKHHKILLSPSLTFSRSQVCYRDLIERIGQQNLAEMSKEQLETVRQSVDFTEICVGPYSLYTTQGSEGIILAEANELRAFWEAHSQV